MTHRSPEKIIGMVLFLPITLFNDVSGTQRQLHMKQVTIWVYSTPLRAVAVHIMIIARTHQHKLKIQDPSSGTNTCVYDVEPCISGEKVQKENYMDYGRRSLCSHVLSMPTETYASSADVR